MRLVARSAASLVGGAAALAVFAVAIAALSRWPLLSASIDPGAVDFTRLTRQPSGGDALVCSKSLCPRAQADLDPPIFTSSAGEIEQKLRLHASRSALIDEIRLEGDPNLLRFVQRSSLFGAPSFVDILVDPLSSGAATVAMYARSGASSNHAKRLRQLREWLAAIGR